MPTCSVIMRARASGAHTRQPDGRRIPFHGDQFDIAPISIEVRPHAIEHSLNTFLRNHEWLPVKTVKSPAPVVRTRGTGGQPGCQQRDDGSPGILAGFRRRRVETASGSGDYSTGQRGKNPDPLTRSPICRAGTFRSGSESDPGSIPGAWRHASGSIRSARAPERAAIVRVARDRCRRPAARPDR